MCVSGVKRWNKRKIEVYVGTNENVYIISGWAGINNNNIWFGSCVSFFSLFSKFSVVFFRALFARVVLAAFLGCSRARVHCVGVGAGELEWVKTESTAPKRNMSFASTCLVPFSMEKLKSFLVSTWILLYPSESASTIVHDCTCIARETTRHVHWCMWSSHTIDVSLRPLKPLNCRSEETRNERRRKTVSS